MIVNLARDWQLSANNRRRKDFYSLSAADQSLLRELGWLEKLEEVDERIERNAMFLRDIIDHPEIFVNPDHHGTKNAEENDREGATYCPINYCQRY
jgi:carnosine N-methyltransferase